MMDADLSNLVVLNILLTQQKKPTKKTKTKNHGHNKARRKENKEGRTKRREIERASEKDE